MAKVMVSIPVDLLTRIDAEVTRRGTTRSSLLGTAAERELARRDRDLMAEAVQRSERRFDGAGRFDASDLVRRNRDLHR